MDWIKVSVCTSSAGIEAVTGRLYQLGITGLEIEDYEDFRDFLEGNRQYWDYVDADLIESKKSETRINVYVSDDLSGRELLAQIRASMAALQEADKENKLGRLSVETEGTRSEDWSENWKKYFHTTAVGDKILIRPQWEEISEKTDRVVFSIDPGMSFGTGSHETTRLCLEELEKYIKPGVKMLDLGCGSGILSIVSLLLGAAEATAVDIDPNAVSTAYSNAARNGIDKEKYRVFSGNILTDTVLKQKIAENRYDVIAANIVADVIIGLAPEVKQYMTGDGVFICSGIIDTREEDVRSALTESGFEIIHSARMKDWTAMVCIVQ